MGAAATLLLLLTQCRLDNIQFLAYHMQDCHSGLSRDATSTCPHTMLCVWLLPVCQARPPHGGRAPLLLLLLVSFTWPPGSTIRAAKAAVACPNDDVFPVLQRTCSVYKAPNCDVCSCEVQQVCQQIVDAVQTQPAPCSLQPLYDKETLASEVACLSMLEVPARLSNAVLSIHDMQLHTCMQQARNSCMLLILLHKAEEHAAIPGLLHACMQLHISKNLKTRSMQLFSRFTLLREYLLVMMQVRMTWHVSTSCLLAPHQCRLGPVQTTISD